MQKNKVIHTHTHRGGVEEGEGRGERRRRRRRILTSTAITESIVRGSSGIRQLGLRGRNGKEDGQGEDVPTGNGGIRH